MAGPTTETKSTFSFKKLLGKAHTSNNRPFFSEGIPSQISIDIGAILGEDIPEDPQTAVNQGIAEFVELDLQQITASNGLAYNIRFPSTYSGTFGTGVQGDLVRDHTQIVNQKRNLSGQANSSHTGGYVYDLEDSTGTEIPSGASENWLLDPVAGIIVSEQVISELDNNGGIVKAYLYTGDTLSQVINNTQSGDLEVQEDSTTVQSNTSVLNFGTGIDVVDEGGNKVTIDAEFTESDVTGGRAIQVTQSSGTAEVALDGDFSRIAFSGDGIQKQFDIAHGLGEEPGYWIVNATTDDGSGISHVQADSTNITVSYDTPPPSGTDNIILNWLAIRGNVIV